MTFTVHIPHWLAWIGLGVLAGVVVTAVLFTRAIRDAIGRGLGW